MLAFRVTNNSTIKYTMYIKISPDLELCNCEFVQFLVKNKSINIRLPTSHKKIDTNVTFFIINLGGLTFCTDLLDILAII